MTTTTTWPVHPVDAERQRLREDLEACMEQRDELRKQLSDSDRRLHNERSHHAATLEELLAVRAELAELKRGPRHRRDYREYLGRKECSNPCRDDRCPKHGAAVRWAQADGEE